MSRRNSTAKSGFLGNLWLRIGLLVTAAFAIVGGYWFLNSQATPFRTASSLDALLYSSSAGTLRGNSYKIEGVVDNMLALSPSEGRLLSIRVENGKYVIPLLVTKEFNSINLQKEQRYIFLAKVGEKGVLRTEKVSKP